MFNIMDLFSLFGGQNGFMQRLNLFGQQFSQQNDCTPEQRVQQLMSSRQMSQEQFDQFSEIATRITGRRPF